MFLTVELYITYIMLQLNIIKNRHIFNLMKNGIIIIGSGHAGGIAAITLRQKKYLGQILIICLLYTSDAADE